MKVSYILVLMLLISFGSIGAVAFTPGLPAIGHFFLISDQAAGLTLTFYLLGYTIGQLVYGPLANRYGSRNTIIFCAITEIIGAGCCILSAKLNMFDLLLIARVIMALGAGGGLTLSLTVSSKLCSTEENARVMSLLVIAFAITPGLGVFIGGVLVNHYGWVGPFCFMFIYGFVILLLSLILPEVFHDRKMDALNPKQLVQNYLKQLTKPVICGGLLVGSGTSCIYTFAALAPNLAISTMNVSPGYYGMYNFIPVTGMLFGSILASYLTKVITPVQSIKLGIGISMFGVMLLFFGVLVLKNPLGLFTPMLVLYVGLSLLFGNGSALGLDQSKDKSNASAVLSFVNMGSTVFATTLLSVFSIHLAIMLPILCLWYLLLATFWFYCLKSG